MYDKFSYCQEKKFGLQGCNLIFQMLLANVASSQARFFVSIFHQFADKTLQIAVNTRHYRLCFADTNADMIDLLTRILIQT